MLSRSSSVSGILLMSVFIVDLAATLNMFALWVRYLRLVDNSQKQGNESLAQRSNQAKFSHRMPGIQQSPVAYNFQHLREYSSCRIWASQSCRPPYVADVEGRARIEDVAASIHESYMDAHGNTVAEDAVFKTPCVVIIFEEAPR